MDFQPPDRADLVNVRSLNLAFLEFLGTGKPAASLTAALPETLGTRLAELGVEGCRRLAGSPFLLFSIAEDDAASWRALFEQRFAPDLLTGICRPAEAEARITIAALGMLWELARRRPYAARVVCGASLSWCERLAACSPFELFSYAAAEPGLLRLRLASHATFWRRLLLAASSNEAALRTAVRLTALQTMLTTAGTPGHEQFRAAACSMRDTGVSVAECRNVSQSRGRGYNTPPDESTPNKKSHQDLRERQPGAERDQSRR